MFQSFAFMSRRDFIAAAAMAAAGIVCSSPRGVFAAEPEKRSVTIAVGESLLLPADGARRLDGLL